MKLDFLTKYILNTQHYVVQVQNVDLDENIYSVAFELVEDPLDDLTFSADWEFKSIPEVFIRRENPGRWVMVDSEFDDTEFLESVGSQISEYEGSV